MQSPEPTCGSIIDREGDTWFAYAGGWLLEGQYPLQPWSYVSKYGPFTDGEDVDLFRADVEAYLSGEVQEEAGST
ncbi:hypothetical protein KFZ73_14570 [Tsukamurella paurometabola]|uniref:Uncharacterized protein n=1 Tax=Tsukamurella paurometabola TaxID=2061 RepID=A0ABS5NGB5_TSUPA|nr:hypothetical protein [Tsukamurella paurometabola]